MKISDFEEQFTAWLDGRLTGENSAAFEKEMRERGFDPAAERREAGPLGNLLRTHSPAPVLANAEFFNHQLLERIQQERPAAPAAVPQHRWWSLPRMAWAGVACLLMAGGLFVAFIPHGHQSDQPAYYAQVVDSRPGDDSLSADTLDDERDNMTVIWIDGMDYLPADYKLQ